MGVIKRQGLKSSLVNYAGILLGVVFFNFIFPHLISKEHLGLIGLVQYLMYVLAMFPALGLGHTLLRYYTLWQGTDLLPRFHGLSLRLFTLGMLGFSMLYFLFKDYIINFYIKQSALFIPYYHFVLPLVFFYILTQYFELYSLLKLRVTVPTFLREIFVRLSLILLVYLFYWQCLTELQFVWGLVITYGLAFLAIWFYVVKFLNFRSASPFPWPSSEFSLNKPLLYGAEMLLFTVCTNLHNFMDGIILPAFMGLGALAIYRIPLVLGQMIQVPYRAISLISIPILREALAQKDIKKVDELNRNIALNLFLIGTYLFTLLIINEESLFRLLPFEYDQGKWVLYIIAFGRLVDMSFGLNSEIILNSNHYRYLTFFSVVMMVVTLALDIILIPQFGMNGAAFAVSFSLILFNLLKNWFIWTRFKIYCFSYHYFSLSFILIGVLFVFKYIPFLHLIQHHQFVNALANVILRTCLATPMFLFPVYWLNISPDFNSFTGMIITGKIFKGGHRMSEL